MASFIGGKAVEYETVDLQIDSLFVVLNKPVFVLSHDGHDLVA